MTLNFQKNLVLNMTSWELNPLKFDVELINKTNIIDPTQIFGFYGSDFQPFNQGVLWDERFN